MKQVNIPSLVSCPKMHDHGQVNVKWVFEESDPFALTIHVEDTDEFWQVDRLEFISRLHQAEPGSALQCGVLSLQLRLSNPEALSLRFVTYTAYGEHYTYLVCNVFKVAKFLDSLRRIAPKSYAECDVDDVITKIFTT